MQGNEFTRAQVDLSKSRFIGTLENVDTVSAQDLDTLFSSPGLVNTLAENGFFIIDYRGKRAFADKVWLDMGYTLDDIWSDNYLQFAHPDDSISLKAAHEKLDSGVVDVHRGEYRFKNKNGEYIWLAVSYRILGRDAAGKPLVFLGHDTDVSRLHEAQEELRDRLVEIETLRDLIMGINKSLDFEETIRRVIDHLHRVLPFDRATVQSLEAGYLHVIGYYGFDKEVVPDLVFPARDIDNPAVRAIRSRRPMVCNDVIQDFPGFIQTESDHPIRSWLGIPLIVEGRTIGLFALDSFKPSFYTERHVRIAAGVAEHIAMAVEHARVHTRVREQARTDRLTGVGNRYGFETLGQDIFRKAIKDESPLGILMLDIDHFKSVNDAFGHACGDQVLKAITAMIASNLRNDDYLVRYGGEEFLVLLPETPTREALVVAERLRTRIPAISIEGPGNCPTVSIGVFSGVPGPDDQMNDFVDKSDLALFEAKRTGRNRSRVWTPRPDFLEERNKDAT